MGKSIFEPLPPIPKDFTVVDLIDGLGGPNAFAKICGFTVNTYARGCDMRRRQSVSKDYWPAIIKASYRAGYAHVSLETIFAAHRKPKLKKVRPRLRRKTTLVA
jgi:hypothetical protein